MGDTGWRGRRLIVTLACRLSVPPCDEGLTVLSARLADEYLDCPVERCSCVSGPRCLFAGTDEE